MFEMGLDKTHLTLIHSNKTPAKTFESAFIKFAINKYFISIGAYSIYVCLYMLCTETLVTGILLMFNVGFFVIKTCQIESIIVLTSQPI